MLRTIVLVLVVGLTATVSAKERLPFSVSSTVPSPANGPDIAYARAMSVYQQVMYKALPPIPERKCGKDLFSMLLRAARMSVVHKINENELLAELRWKRCIDRHFHVFSTTWFDAELKQECSKFPFELEWIADLWRLKIFELNDDKMVRGTDACKDRSQRFEEFVERIRTYRTGFWPGDSYVLDLRDTSGGSVYGMNFVLAHMFAPHPIAGYSVIMRRGPVTNKYGTWATKPGLFGCPRAILINHGTASAAEIVADEVRSGCPESRTIGQQSYGKFAGTQFLPLANVTVQISYTLYTTGRREKSLNYIGITPDMVVPPGTELEFALEYIKNNTQKAARTPGQ